MKFLIFWNKCKKCGFSFETLSDPGLYSFRLLLSEKAQCPAIVKCDDDPAFSEVYEIVERLLKNKGFKAIQIANIFDKIFGYICDRAPNGSRYNMTGEKNCPHCGSDDIDFGPYDPEVYREENPPEITHVQWDKLDRRSKEKEIELRIKSL
jgi:predicted Zn-ribbon and HTH transcriptional regulator